MCVCVSFIFKILQNDNISELKQLTSNQLTELLGEMESLVGALSETLIAELALRDELEYEKELKNQFISLLLAVQNRRRQHHVTKKKNQMQNGTSPLPQHRSLQESKYLTTVIPYHTDSGPPDNQALQVLIKSNSNYFFSFFLFVKIIVPI